MLKPQCSVKRGSVEKLESLSGQAGEPCCVGLCWKLYFAYLTIAAFSVNARTVVVSHHSQKYTFFVMPSGKKTITPDSLQHRTHAYPKHMEISMTADGHLQLLLK